MLKRLQEKTKYFKRFTGLTKKQFDYLAGKLEPILQCNKYKNLSKRNRKVGGGRKEKLEKTLHDQISLAESRALNSESIVNAVRLITSKIQQSDTDGIEQIMKELVPEYMQRNLAEGTDSAQVISFSR